MLHILHPQMDGILPYFYFQPHFWRLQNPSIFWKTKLVALNPFEKIWCNPFDHLDHVPWVKKCQKLKASNHFPGGINRLPKTHLAPKNELYQKNEKNPLPTIHFQVLCQKSSIFRCYICHLRFKGGFNKKVFETSSCRNHRSFQIHLSLPRLCRIELQILLIAVHLDFEDRWAITWLRKFFPKNILPGSLTKIPLKNP